MKKIKQNPSKTLLTICIGFTFIFLITNQFIFVYIVIILGLLGIFSDFLSLQIEKIWFKFAELLGYFVPNIFLTLIYFFFLFPISLFSKVFTSRDLLKLKDTGSSTYVIREKKYKKSDFINPW